MANAVIRRIEYAKKNGARIASKGQNDTVIVRPLIVQLDSESIKGHENTWVWDMISILEDMFGNENILGFSIHRDETNIHIHVLFVPCYEERKATGKIKCTLSQTQFFKNPRQLAGMHKRIRKQLIDKGYHIEKDNKPIEEQLAGYTDKQGVWHQQGLTPDQLKAITNRHKELNEKEREIMLSKEELEVLSKAMSDVQEKAKVTQENLENSVRMFECQQADFENEKATLKTQMQAILEEREKLNKMRKSTNDMLERVYSVSDICNKIIEEEHTLNKDFLDFLDTIGQKNNIPLRQNIEKLFKKFDRERKERMKKRYEESAIPDYRRTKAPTLDDVIARRIREKEEHSNNQFDFV